MKTTRSGKRPLRLVWAEAGSLADNPRNWRRHGKAQRQALAAVMGDVGWAGALLYNETTRRLIDGHCRKAAVDPRTLVPVLVGRWSEEQERTVLASLDPLGAMAGADAEALERLLAEVDLSCPDVEALAASLAQTIAAANDPPTDEDVTDQPKPGGDETAQDRKKAAARSRRVSELYSVIVECKNERDQLAFYRRMQKEGRKCKLYVL